jgi:hypothetical protein
MKGPWLLALSSSRCSGWASLPCLPRRTAGKPTRFAAGVLILTALGGCSTTACPCLCHPGSAQVQQARALRYDPYPENESGPAMVGVRPREYEKPPPETSRARWTLGKWGQ